MNEQKEQDRLRELKSFKRMSIFFVWLLVSAIPVAVGIVTAILVDSRWFLGLIGGLLVGIGLTYTGLANRDFYGGFMESVEENFEQMQNEMVEDPDEPDDSDILPPPDDTSSADE